MSVLNSVTDFLRNIIDSTSDPNAVYEVKADVHSAWPVYRRDECLCLYGPQPARDGTPVYDLVVQQPLSGGSDRQFVLARTRDAAAGAAQLAQLGQLLPLLVRRWPRDTLQLPLLQRLCDALRLHAGWSAAHVCAQLQWAEPLQLPEMAAQLSQPCRQTGVTPLHIAVQQGQLRFVARLLQLQPPPDLQLADNDGNTVLHVAARGPKEVLAALLALAPPELVNARNKQHLTALHVACTEDKPENVKLLLVAGADVNVTGRCDELPIHTALTAGSPRCAKEIIEKFPNQLNAKDMKKGGTPLHWAKSVDVLTALIELGCNINAQDFQGDTALHVMVAKRLLDNVVALLSRGADVDARDRDGNSPLLLAVALADVPLTRALVVFGADLALRNRAGESARHRAATLRKHADTLVYTLHAVGAPRCPGATKGCREGCVAGGEGIGVPPESPARQRARHHFDEVLAASALGHSLAEARRAGAGQPRCRVLCLDGGGVRGLLLVQTLTEIEKLAGKPILECFDWVGGTSIGGMLALALSLGKPLPECQRLFFRLKDQVLVGSRPYSNEKLEGFLKQEFGEETVMAELRRPPRLLVTAALTDRHPADLHLFRNYEDAATMMQVVETSTFTPPPPPADQLVWRAARSSGAAPTFFRASGRFIDGGLIANNPTMDVLTEIFEQNVALRASGRAAEAVSPTAVLSLGCGRPPVAEVSAIDVFTPDSIWDITKVSSGVQSLLRLITDQATSVDNRVVDRARAWCGSLGVPYLRCTPQLTLDLLLDETDNERLLHVMWQSRVYLETKKDILKEFVATLL